MLSLLLPLCFPRLILNSGRGEIYFRYTCPLPSTRWHRYPCRCRHLRPLHRRTELLSGGFEAGAAQSLAEAMGGGPSQPLASSTEMWGSFEVTTTQVEAPQSSPKRKSFIFKQRGKFLSTLVFPLKQNSEQLFFRGSIKQQLFSISTRLWVRGNRLPVLQHERCKLDRRKYGGTGQGLRMEIGRADVVAFRSGRWTI